MVMSLKHCCSSSALPCAFGDREVWIVSLVAKKLAENKVSCRERRGSSMVHGRW